MVAVEKYIRKLLYEQDCVIIPDLGGLLTHHINAQYNSTSGVFSPSQKRVAFNEVLKLDDGLLTYFISVNEKISREEAQVNVKRYAESLRLSLREAGVATIAGVGDFRNNEEGKLVFEPDSQQNFNVDWFGLQQVKAVELKSAVAQPTREEAKKEFAAMPVVVAEEVPTYEQDEDEDAGRKIKWGWSGWAAAAAVVGMAFYLSVFFAGGATSGTKGSMLSTLNPFYGISEFVQTAMVKKMVVEETHSPVSIQPEPAEIIPFNQASGLIIPGNYASAEPNSQVATGTDVIIPALGTQNPSNISLSPAENAVKKFYIIAGSFESMKNAGLLLDALQKEGFNTAFIMEPKGRGLIKVSAIGFDSSREAYANLGEVEKVAGEGVWVYKNRR
ncbi:SPOR domain-containing protein [Telluribacter sp.]|jgi:cell division septation protein DedD|uniref:HU domain-containing protein n=1 Tax=Telluribacter sp. TaxID=1978767 RepID=UPI002E0F4547|nr:SPOR domain-containing protein [Telluribacter sp.]